MMIADQHIVDALVFYGTQLPEHRGKWWMVEHLRELLDPQILGEREELRQGLWWMLDPRDYVQQDLFWLGVKDKWELFHVLRLLDRSSVIFDVGANFGYYALVLASRLGRGARIHAFEPNPRTFERLVQHIRWNELPNVKAHCLGISDAVGSAGVQHVSGNSGAAHLVENAGRVPLTTLDMFCRERAIDRLDFIKIDVEGFEEKLLRGGRGTFASLKPMVLIELNPPTARRVGSSVGRVVDLLEEYGYCLYGIRRSTLSPLTELPAGEDYENALCFHRDRRPPGI
jgi:FkbM family methyltransferase